MSTQPLTVVQTNILAASDGYSPCPNGCGNRAWGGEAICYSCRRDAKTAAMIQQRKEASKKRVREVFPSSELPHLWAHQAVPKGRSSSNQSFDGADYYSYSTVIASIVTNPKGKRAFLLSDGKYSVSTSAHQSDVRQAVPHGAVIFHVPGTSRGYSRSWETFSDPQRIISAWTDEVNSLLRDATTAREPKKSRLIISASVKIEKMREFAKFMGLKGVKYPKLPVTKAQLMGLYQLVADHSAKARAAADKAQETRRKNDEIRYAERNARWAKEREEREKLEAELRENAPAVAQRWIDGESINPGTFGRFIPETLLRVKGDNVETSRGATFPVEHARRGLALVKATMARGEEWKSNGHTCKLGYYQIDSISADGTVHAGCHVVPYSSIAAIEGKLTATAEPTAAAPAPGDKGAEKTEG